MDSRSVCYCARAAFEFVTFTFKRTAMLSLGSSGDTPGDDDFEEGQFEIGPFTQMK